MAKYQLTILTVCGAGVGSSLMVKMNAEEVLLKHGIRAKIINSDVTSAKGNKADILLTTDDIYRLIRNIEITNVVILSNMVSKSELEEKLVPICKKFIEEAV
ncbi:MAG: hypothetical protein APF77_07270 [Clostridia bacterium BRH_c25]|nr:MAG: hypothetical protein APF77_07270 [Clostridia bacterium BRH_c25]